MGTQRKFSRRGKPLPRHGNGTSGRQSGTGFKEGREHHAWVKQTTVPLPSKSSSQHPISKYLYPLGCGGKERDRKAVTRWKGKPELEKKK